MNTFMNSNPGVGLQMTSRRSILDQSNTNKNTPGPQSYHVEFKLTDREKRQNELLSRRYVNWNKGGGGGTIVFEEGMVKRQQMQQQQQQKQKQQQQQLQSLLNISGNGDTCDTSKNQMTSRRPVQEQDKYAPPTLSLLSSSSSAAAATTTTTVDVPFYDVEYKLSDREKRQNELLSQRYEMHC